jgi:hypothetical protein
MKKYLLSLLLCAALSLSVAQTPERNVLSSYRIEPVPGKDSQLRKALMEHAAKYHSGQWKWRVFQVLSGHEEGAYMINEGVNSWTDLEGRKEISDEHQRDYEKNILPLCEKTLPAIYLTYQKDYSSDSAGGPLKKALLRHFYLKPGKAGRLTPYLATWKKVYERLGMKVGVWGSFFSGQAQFVVSYRLGNGWADLEKNWGKLTREGYDEIAGAGAYVRFVEDLDTYVDRIDEEMIEFLPDVSPK